ncbi:WhiB family transcriptional regulator [Euzebya sp.]|uniref:WhiB family transcriptional regulator n=1 Tax=Euzebya sp. TaxID=1971409 RepID=UPI0035148E97
MTATSIPDRLVAECIEAGQHLRATRRFAGEPFDRCHGCGQPVIVEPAPGWQDRGLCTTGDPDMFYPEAGQQELADRAVDICAGCPVIVECGAYALLHEPVGVWGGMTAPERRAIRRQLGITVDVPGGLRASRLARNGRVRQLAAAGWTAGEIAAELDISDREVHRILRDRDDQADAA